jgi:hypothetical protein
MLASGSLREDVQLKDATPDKYEFLLPPHWHD